MEILEVTKRMNGMSLECDHEAMDGHTHDITEGIEELSMDDDGYMNELKRFYEDILYNRRHRSKKNIAKPGFESIQFKELEALYAIYKNRYRDITLPQLMNRISLYRRGYICKEINQWRYYWKMKYVNMKYIAANIPDEIECLTELVDLDYSWNEIANIPICIWNMSTLQYLNLSHNYIDYIPDSISNMTSLKSLSLDHNIITVIPDIIYTLPRLRYVDLSYNPIKSLPPGISKMKSIVTFRIHHTYIKEWPYEATMTSGLATHDLYGDYNEDDVSYVYDERYNLD